MHAIKHPYAKQLLEHGATFNFREEPFSVVFVVLLRQRERYIRLPLSPNRLNNYHLYPPLQGDEWDIRNDIPHRLDGGHPNSPSFDHGLRLQRPVEVIVSLERWRDNVGCLYADIQYL
jgi:hypothetical protein